MTFKRKLAVGLTSLFCLVCQRDTPSTPIIEQNISDKHISITKPTTPDINSDTDADFLQEKAKMDAHASNDDKWKVTIVSLLLGFSAIAGAEISKYYEKKKKSPPTP